MPGSRYCLPMRWFRRTQVGMRNPDTPISESGLEPQGLVGQGRLIPPEARGPRPPRKKFSFRRSPLDELLEDRGE
jgi:hypothetical protein